MSAIISVTNQKGGVGKTTTAVNLAASLCQEGKRVLLIDMDPQGHSGEHLSIKVTTIENNQKVSTKEVLTKERTLLDSLYQSYIPNLWVLPSDLSLGSINQLAPQGKQFMLKEAISSQIHQNFDFIILDCQPSLSLLTLNALTSSDHVLLPVQAEFLALDGLSQLILTLKEVQTKLHPRLQVLGILLTMYDSRNRLSGEVLTELKNNFGDKIFETIIPRNVKLAEAPSFGKSIFDYDKNSLGGQAYTQLGQEVIKRIKNA